jgi:hypothetical protein
MLFYISAEMRNIEAFYEAHPEDKPKGELL